MSYDDSSTDDAEDDSFDFPMVEARALLGPSKRARRSSNALAVIAGFSVIVFGFVVVVRALNSNQPGVADTNAMPQLFTPSGTPTSGATCPKGYTQQRGDWPGWDNIGHDGEVWHVLNPMDCAKACTSNERCCSFEHGWSNDHGNGWYCNMNPKAGWHPKRNTSKVNQLFCSRDSCFQTPSSQTCAKGFKSTPGNIKGSRTLGNASLVNVSSSDACALSCNIGEGCMSYEWSASEQICHLNKERDPDSKSQPKNDIFCQREFSTVTECPKGFELGAGFELSFELEDEFGHKGSVLYLPSIAECAKRCLKENECRSFEYNPATAACQQNRPVTTRNEKGAVFCSRKGDKKRAPEEKNGKTHPALKSDERTSKADVAVDSKVFACPENYRAVARLPPSNTSKSDGCNIPRTLCPLVDWLRWLANGPETGPDNFDNSRRDCVAKCKIVGCLSFEYSRSTELCLVFDQMVPPGPLKELDSEFCQLITGPP